MQQSDPRARVVVRVLQEYAPYVDLLTGREHTWRETESTVQLEPTDRGGIYQAPDGSHWMGCTDSVWRRARPASASIMVDPDECECGGKRWLIMATDGDDSRDWIEACSDCSPRLSDEQAARIASAETGRSFGWACVHGDPDTEARPFLDPPADNLPELERLLCDAREIVDAQHVIWREKGRVLELLDEAFGILNPVDLTPGNAAYALGVLGTQMRVIIDRLGAEGILLEDGRNMIEDHVSAGLDEVDHAIDALKACDPETDA